MLVTCPECGLKISEAAKTCPGCGLPDAGMLSKEWCEREAKEWDGKQIIPDNGHADGIRGRICECETVYDRYNKVRIKADVEKWSIGYRVIFLFPCPACGKRVKTPEHNHSSYSRVY